MNLLFVRHLTVIDFSYLHPSRGVVGESWIVDLELGGDLDEQGMVFDFGHVKRVIKAGIDQLLDHKLAVPIHLPKLSIQTESDSITLHVPLSTGGEIEHRSPAEAVALLEVENISPEGIAPILSTALKERLPSNVLHVGIQLRQEQMDGAFYQYSHGLKKHDGNCQRIAHGHRSRLEIYLDGVRNIELEQDWAQQWQDIYVGTQEDVGGRSTVGQLEHMEFRYQARQGEFFLRLPASSVYLMDTDTTVEWIAHHIAQQVKIKNPQSTVTVRAYEGVDKGAIAIC